VFGVFWAFVLAAISLGTVLAPLAVNAFGLRGGLLAAAFVPCAIGLLGFPSLLAIDRRAAATTAALEPRVAVLEGLGIFATASRNVLERLAGAASEAAFAAGTPIIVEGEEADMLYVLVEGEVEVTARGERGGEARVLRRMSAPSYFGEIGVLERIPRTASVTAVSDCRCEAIEGDALLEALSAAPPSSALMENARSRLALTHPSRQPAFAADASAP
jgi:hypothetical protein